MARTAAQAERLVTSVSTHRVLITSNFAGTELACSRHRRGAAEYADRRLRRRRQRAWPARSYVTRHKERMLGLWVNRDSREFSKCLPTSHDEHKPIAEIGFGRDAAPVPDRARQ